MAASSTLGLTFMLHVFRLFCLQAGSEIEGYTRVDLTGDHWLVTDYEKGISSRGSVPGSMYTAILPKTRKANPLYRDNDMRYAWMALDAWTYTANFTVSSYQASANAVTLVCEGLDTVASVFLNGQLIAKTDNMFTRYTIPVRGHITKGSNTISIQFLSAVKEAKDEKWLYTYTIPPECPPKIQNGQCHVNLLRKEQCSFSWDWGPSFPTQGIWKPIYLDTFNSAILTGISAVPLKVNGEWQIKVEAYFDVIQGSEVKGQLEIKLKDLGFQQLQTITLSSTSNVASFNLTVPKTANVQLWWPRGYGAQTLYSLSGSFTSGFDQSSKEIKIGFRTVELIQEQISSNASHGLSFYFKINGLPIFLKGSNWIPADNFQENITESRIRYLLQSSADVGMNAMRVWGGGVYESDYFYEVADELGIMIWQDLMFSVAMYPASKIFLDSVSREVTQQMQRLKHHVCIILWAGSNENEKALRDNWFATEIHFDKYFSDFITLYVHTIMPIVTSEDQSREYLVSSPTDGAQSVKEGYVAANPDSEYYGDIHYYDYAADQWDPSVFRIPRSATEYGIQAWCNAESLSSVFEELDYAMESYMASHRQHHGLGNLEMAGEVGMHMKMPSSADNKTRFFDFIYLTQINQAMSMRTQTEHYRRFQTIIQSDGRGLTMAALYWQLNDIWQAPTWASIDYEGRWKMLHYYAKHFFSPQLVSPFFRNQNLNVYMVVDEIPTVDKHQSKEGTLTFQPMLHFSQVLDSELPVSQTFKVMHTVSSATGGFLNVLIHRYDRFEPIFSWTVPYKLTSTSELVFKKKTKALLSESNCPSKRDCILSFQASNSAGTVVSSSWLAMSYPKDANLIPANITVEAVSKISPTTYKIDLLTDHIALFVWLSHASVLGHFSDNGFPMLSPRASVEFYTNTSTLPDILRASLHVRSITDVN